MLEIKDEILNTSGQTDNNARYRIRNNNGDILQDDVQLELKTPVAQQGTALNKSNLEKAIMTRIGRDYVVNGGAITYAKAHEDIEQGKMVEFRESETPSGKRIGQTSNASRGRGHSKFTVFERINGKICIYYNESEPNVFKLVNYEDFFKDGLQDKHILGTYTLTTPSETSDWDTSATIIDGVRAYANGTRVAIFFTRYASSTYYHYVRSLQFDSSTYTLTELYTSEKIQNIYGSISHVYGEGNDYAYYIGHTNVGITGQSYLYHIHLNDDGTIIPSLVHTGSNGTWSIGFVLRKNEEIISVKGITTTQYKSSASTKNYIQEIAYTYNTTTNTANLIGTSVIARATDNDAPFGGHVARFNDVDYIRINMDLTGSTPNYVYLKFDDDPTSLTYTTITETAPFASNCHIFYIKNRMIVFKYSNSSPYNYSNVYISTNPNTYSRALCGTIGMTRAATYYYIVSSIYEDSFFLGSCFFLDSSEKYSDALYIFTQEVAILNSEVENTANLRKVKAIAKSNALKGENAWVYTKPGVNIETDRFEVIFDN